MKIFLVLSILAIVDVHGRDPGENQNTTKTLYKKPARESLEYNRVDTDELLRWEAPIEMQKEYPYYLSGFDDENAPIWIAEMGVWDTRKNLELGPKRERDFRKYVLQFLKRCHESTKLRSTPENPVNEFSLIIDMAGFSFRQASNPKTVEFSLWMASQFEQAFRESAKRAFIVNGNYIFTTIFQLMKPILGNNVAKIDVFGNRSENYIPRLLRDFPKDQLPEWYGGVGNHKPIKVYG